jgi:hypothetical protein
MRLITAAIALLLAAPGVAAADEAMAREQEPVVLTGVQLGSWAVPANQTVRAPLIDLVDRGDDPHNHYADPTLDTAPLQPSGTPTEVFTRYLHS